MPIASPFTTRLAGVVLMWAGLGSIGCASTARYRGLIDATDPSHVRLLAPSGGSLRLSTGEDADLFADLGGCSMIVEGPRRAGRVVVKSWVVTDAGDGSAPYIGTLQREGMRWFVDDRQTGARMYFSEGSLGELTQHKGRTVLVAGYVMGPNTVNVVTWRLLGPPTVPEPLR